VRGTRESPGNYLSEWSRDCNNFLVPQSFGACAATLIQLSDDDGKYELADALEGYQKALAIDQEYLDACEEIAYFYDVIRCDPESAEPYFRKAVALGGGKRTRRALLDVMGRIRGKGVIGLDADGLARS
jgi:hypothetical protein